MGGSDHISIVNNSLLKNDGKNTGSGEFQIQYHSTNNIFENNIVYAGSKALMVNDYTSSTPSPATLDYNIYYSSVAAANSNWEWQKKSITGFTTFQTTSGQDAHSQYVDPEYLSITTPDLHVQSSSRAVNAGDNLGSSVGGKRGLRGNPRVQGSSIDIGAYEQ